MPRRPDCHPNERHMGRGLCSACYRREYAKNPIRRARKLKAQSEYVQKNKDKHREWGRKTRLAQYGLTPEQYDEIFARQGGRCAICGTTENGKRKYLSVDHDHETGQVRGLLCGRCNWGIGLLNDDPGIMLRAASYVATLPLAPIVESLREAA
jgi:hypothetical protein